MEHIFRAYDIRGIWNKDLDPDICLDLGRGLGTLMMDELGMRKAVVGYDVRKTSPAFHGALVSGLLSTGVDVISTGECGFGVALHAGLSTGADVSCFITASHLEPEWNGLKMYFGNGIGFPEENILKIRDIVLSGKFRKVKWQDAGELSSLDHLDAYNSFWMERYLPLLKDGGISIGVDCGGGAMCLSAPKVLGSCGMNVENVNSEVDPYFSNRPSEPKPENLTDLRDRVVEKGLDFGIAFDGDGDRAVVCDETGRFLSTDRLGIIIARDLVLEYGGGVVLANVESSMAVEDVLEPIGADVKRIKVGHTYLTMEAKETGAIFGVERSGHLIVPRHVLFDDAITAPLEIARILVKEKRPLSEIAIEVPQFASRAFAFDCPDDEKFRVIASLTEELKGKYGNVNDMDGVRVDMEDGWVLMRCSNTSPVVRMTVEARDESSLNRISNLFGDILKSMIDGTE
ncbi:MAG: phosphomannomutase/phosphoglucomutase [Candidatus Thermoplasmatota archaeon]|nr:phosphomannomutase/phosphoglucomutase [Candidatus Thermoplasmatota archaeon]